MFAVIGNLLFFDDIEYETLSASLLTIFKASAGVFNNNVMVSKDETTTKYVFLLIYMIICFILITNLIVGQLSTAYRSYVKRRNVLMLLETLSVREASEADEKYSAAISPPYPLSIVNMLLGTYILSIKNPKHNKLLLMFYFIPTFVGSLIIFIFYQALILPLSYMKVVGHKFALVIKNPQGAGAKTSSDRFGYAVFFALVGFFLLSFAAIADVYWFVKHIFKTDLDTVA